MRYRLILSSLLTLGVAMPVAAGPFSKKPAKIDPAIHVPALLTVLKDDKDEKNRANAASSLRDFDAKAFPDILAALAESLQSDPSTHVREEAAEAIGKIRPITPKAGYALEQSLANEKSIAVKLAVRRALLQYRVLGYFAANKTETASQSAEPPFATAGRGSAGGTVLRPTPTPAPFLPTLASPFSKPVTGPQPEKIQSSEPPILVEPPTRLTDVPAPAQPRTGSILTSLPKLLASAQIVPSPREVRSPEGPVLGPPK